MAKSPFETQPARASFAFSPGQPAQASTSRGGAYNGARIVGGDSQAGVGGDQPTFAGPQDDGIPEFIRASMEPYIKAKQTEQFVKGFTDAVAGKSIKEVQSNDDGIASIFGPSGYHQGAAAFAAKDRYDKFQSELLTNPDLTNSMSTDDLGKFLSDKYQGMMTGDPIADHLLQTSIANGHGPLVDTITKNQVKWQQQQARTAWSSAFDSAASTFQGIAAQQLDLSDAKNKATYDQAEANFTGAVQKPHGMLDATWREAVKDGASAALANGNLFAFRALKARGLLAPGGILNDDEIAALETKYDRAANKAMSDAAMAPDVIAQNAALHADVASGRITAPMEAAKRMAAINSVIMARTGSDLPLYDTSKVVDVANSVTDAAIGAARRQQERSWQLEDRQASWDHEQQVKDQDRAQTAAAVASAASTGNIALYQAKGVISDKDADSFATSAWEKGDMHTLAQNFVGTAGGGGYVAGPVARMAQSQITAFGPKYTQQFDGAYQKWKALNTESPGAAAAYYRGQNVKMTAYDGLINQRVPSAVAYERTFSDPNQFDTSRIPPDQRKPLRDAVDSQVDGMSRSNLNPLTWGKWKLAQSSADTIKSVIGDEAVAYMAHSTMQPSAIVGQVAQSARAGGQYELVGRLAWRNDPGTQPLTRVLHAQQGELDNAFMSVADRRLKAAGFSDGAYGDDYTIHRFGNEGIYIMGSSADGSDHKEVIITMPELKSEMSGTAKKAVQKSVDQAKARDDARSGISMSASANLNERKTKEANASFK